MSVPWPRGFSATWARWLGDQPWSEVGALSSAWWRCPVSLWPAGGLSWLTLPPRPSCGPALRGRSHQLPLRPTTGACLRCLAAIRTRSPQFPRPAVPVHLKLCLLHFISHTFNF